MRRPLAAGLLLVVLAACAGAATEDGDELPGLSQQDVADIIAYVREEQRAVGIE